MKWLNIIIDLIKSFLSKGIKEVKERGVSIDIDTHKVSQGRSRLTFNARINRPMRVPYMRVPCMRSPLLHKLRKRKNRLSNQARKRQYRLK